MPLTVEIAQRKVERLGFTNVQHYASGMEGHVFRLGDGQLAKVWHSKSASEVTLLEHFYALLSTLDLPFGTPLITRVEQVDGAALSVELELTGTPLRDLLRDDDADVPVFALDATLSILSALKDHTLGRGDTYLPILGVAPSLAARRSGAAAVLLEVAEHKVGRYGAQLRRSVPDFDKLYARLMQQLEPTTLEPSREARQLVHGDLCPENILVGAAGEVTAVLDWGFLSLVGDSAFDAATACGFYNMYGPHHRQLDDSLLTACETQLGYSRTQLLRYRALYAVLASNAYAEDGSDGHYAWCAETLRRDDVRSVLLGA